MSVHRPLPPSSHRCISGFTTNDRRPMDEFDSNVPSTALVVRNKDDFIASLPTPKAEEWTNSKKVEVKTTKQIETKLRREVVLEDGEVVQDSGPLITSEIVTDMTEKELETSEHKEDKDSPLPEEHWVALPSATTTTTTKEKRERTVNSHEEAEETVETHEVKHLGDLSHEDLMRMIRDKHSSELASNQKQLSSAYVSFPPKTIYHSAKQKKTVDTANVYEKSIVNGTDIYTQRETSSEREEYNRELAPEDSRQFEEEETQSTYNIRHTKDEDITEYFGVPKGKPFSNGIKLGEGYHDVREKIEEERTGHPENFSGGTFNNNRRRMNGHLELDSFQTPKFNRHSYFESNKSGKKKASDWLNSDFGSADNIDRRSGPSEYKPSNVERIVSGGNNIHISMFPTKSTRSENGHMEQPIVSYPGSPSPFSTLSRVGSKKKHMKNGQKSYEIVELSDDTYQEFGSKIYSPYSTLDKQKGMHTSDYDLLHEKSVSRKQVPRLEKNASPLKSSLSSGFDVNPSQFTDSSNETRQSKLNTKQYEIRQSKYTESTSDRSSSNTPVRNIPIQINGDYVESRPDRIDNIRSKRSPNFQTSKPAVPNRMKTRSKSYENFHETKQRSIDRYTERTHNSPLHQPDSGQRRDKVWRKRYDSDCEKDIDEEDQSRGKNYHSYLQKYNSEKIGMEDNSKSHKQSYFRPSKVETYSSINEMRSHSLPRRTYHKSEDGTKLPKFYFGQEMSADRKYGEHERNNCDYSDRPVHQNDAYSRSQGIIKRSRSFNFLKSSPSRENRAFEGASQFENSRNVQRRLNYSFPKEHQSRSSKASSHDEAERNSVPPRLLFNDTVDSRTYSTLHNEAKDDSNSKRNRFLKELLRTAPDLFSHLHRKDKIDSATPKSGKSVGKRAPTPYRKIATPKFFNRDGEPPVAPPRKKSHRTSQLAHKNYRLDASPSREKVTKKPATNGILSSKQKDYSKQDKENYDSTNTKMQSPYISQYDYYLMNSPRTQFKAPMYKKFSQLRDESSVSKSTPNLIEEKSHYTTASRKPVAEANFSSGRTKSSTDLNRSHSLQHDSKTSVPKGNLRLSAQENPRVRTLYSLTIPAPQKARSSTPESANSSIHTKLVSSGKDTLDAKTASSRRTKREDVQLNSERQYRNHVFEKVSPNPSPSYKTVTIVGQ